MSENKVLVVDFEQKNKSPEQALKQDETPARKQLIKHANVLIPYDLTEIRRGRGFTNFTGTMCYHNSLMQCILSLPAIYKILSETPYQHFLTQTLKQFWESYHNPSEETTNTQVNELNQKLWNTIIEISKKRADIKQFDRGQQDANEGFMFFLSVIEKTVPDLYSLFEHVYSNIIYCVDCSAQLRVEKKGTVIHVNHSPETNQHPMFSKFPQPKTLNEYIISHSSHIVGYKCEKCDSRKDKLSINLIRGVPEILTVLFEKYYDKTEMNFPEELAFCSNTPNENLVYRLVAQCEHSGNQGGGHYWAIVQRSNGVVNLNDNSVSSAVFKPTSNTYMVFYHYVGKRSIKRK